MLNSASVPTTINFFRPQYVSVDVTVKVRRLTGYTREVEASIIEYVKYYLSILAVGQSVYLSSIWAIAARAIEDITNPSFSVSEVKLGIHGQPLAVADIPVKFNVVARYASCTITAEGA